MLHPGAAGLEHTSYGGIALRIATVAGHRSPIGPAS
jgi:hypothetical protein